MRSEWRFIDSGTHGAAFNMALDEAIATAVRRGISAPTLRLYGWNQVSISIGCFQKAADINVACCRENGIPIVRRLTGGRAVCHHDEITYSFSTQTSTGPFSYGLFDSYKKISAALTDALTLLGVTAQRETGKRKPKVSGQGPTYHNPLCFCSVSYGEISVGEAKVIGSAQKRWTDGLFQQGSIPFTVDEYLVSMLFEQFAIVTGGRPVTGLKYLLPALSRDELKDAIRTAFEEFFQIALIDATPSEKELSRAYDLESKKYLNDAWTFSR